MILVTGAAGYVGSALVERLLAGGQEVRAIDDFSEGMVRQIKHLSVNPMDITVREQGEAMMEGVRVLVHLAAITGIPQCEQRPDRACSVNVAGLKLLVEAGVRDRLEKVLFPSSMAVYGNPPRRITEQTPLRPVNYYGILKRTSEDILNVAQELHDLQVLIFRQSNIHGRSLCRKRSLINLLAERARSGQPLLLVGSGEQVRDFVHLDDVLGLYIEALSSSISGTFNLGSGVSTSINEVFTLVRTIAQEQLDREVVVERQPSRMSTAREVEDYFDLDISRLREAFSFSPRRSIEDSLRDLLSSDGDDPGHALR